MQPLSPQHVKDALAQFDFAVNYLTFDESTATSELAAEAIGCTVAQIAKSICFMINKDYPLLVVTSGVNMVDDKKISALEGVGRKKVKIAKPEECIEIFGYAPGGVPPVGHRTDGIKIYLDSDLQQFDKVYAACGTANENFGITPPNLALATNGTWQDVKKD